MNEKHAFRKITLPRNSKFSFLFHRTRTQRPNNTYNSDIYLSCLRLDRLCWDSKSQGTNDNANTKGGHTEDIPQLPPPPLSLPKPHRYLAFDFLVSITKESVLRQDGGRGGHIVSDRKQFIPILK